MATGSASKTEYLFGYSAERHAAWRATISNGKPGRKEFTTNFKEPAKVDDAEDEKAVACWPDGLEASIDNYSVADFRSGPAKRLRRIPHKRPSAAHLKTPDGKPL